MDGWMDFSSDGLQAVLAIDRRQPGKLGGASGMWSLRRTAKLIIDDTPPTFDLLVASLCAIDRKTGQ